MDSPREQTLRELYRFASRFRIVGMLVVSGLLVFAHELLRTWQIVVFVIVVAGLGGSVIAERAGMLRGPDSLRWLPMVSVALVSQALVIASTGGIRSPLAIIFVPITMITALVSGWRGLRPLLTIQLLVLWGLSFAELFSLIPAEAFPTSLMFSMDPAGTVLWTAVLTSLLVAVGVFGVRLTSLLRDSDQAALAARAEAARALQSRNQDLLALTGAIGHELKNPLTAAQGLATLLRDQAPGTPHDPEVLEVMVEELHRVRDTLETFLNFSRPLDDLQLQTVEVAEVLARVVAAQEGLADERGVDLRLDSDAEATMQLDPRKVQQIMVNLVQNAIEASPRGGRVVLRLAPGPDEVAVLVQDEGPGVAPELRERLFRPGATTRPEGTGLGLVISRGLAEQHGGTLTLEDAASGGCLARLTLPRTEPS